jgi:hypothetical protein
VTRGGRPTLVLLPALAAAIACASACAGTGVWTALSSGSELHSSPIVYRGGSAWFATAISTPGGDRNVVRIYRRRRRHWTLAGLVRAREFPCIHGGPYAVALTGRSTPDFTIRCDGADTPWYGVIGYVGGSWRLVPFDFGTGVQVAVTATGTVGHRVHAWLNAGGCASCVDSAAWYAFDGKLFVPVNPPGGTIGCTPADVWSAPRYTWFGDRLLQGRGNLNGRFTPTAVACDDGWAVASGTLNGRPRLALYEQVGRRWRKDAVAPPRAMNAHATSIFVLPQSLYLHLASRVEASTEPRPRFQPLWDGAFEPHGPWGFHKAQEKPVWVEVGPGRRLQAAEAVVSSHGRWRAMVIRTRRHAAVWIFAWRRRRWVRRARVLLRVPADDASRELWVTLDQLTPSPNPDVVLRGPCSDPDWQALVSRASGSWTVVPWRVGGHTVRVVEVARSVMSDSTLVRTRHATTAYRYRQGLMEPIASTRETDRACRLNALEHAARTRILQRASCGYGWALATGRNRRGHSYAAVFEDRGGAWRLDSAGPGVGAASTASYLPSWLVRDLAARLSE